MAEENAATAADKRRLELPASNDDLLVRILDIPATSYECVTVNGSWYDKGLSKGDIVLCARGQMAGEGDIVLIEQDGQEKLAIMSSPGFLETPRGSRMLEANENIVAVGMALTRKLRP
jgi:hypothetical protein